MDDYPVKLHLYFNDDRLTKFEIHYREIDGLSKQQLQDKFLDAYETLIGFVGWQADQLNDEWSEENTLSATWDSYPVVQFKGEFNSEDGNKLYFQLTLE